MKTEDTVNEGRFAYEGLDRVIHERARLSVLTSLITSAKGLPFNDLKQLCSLTDGNLSRHLKVLEAGRHGENYEGTGTEAAADDLPDYGCRRKRYLEYLTTLEQVVKDTAKVAADAGMPRMMGAATA